MGEILDFWKGPDSGRYDFEIFNSLIEVKTMLSDPPSIKIAARTIIQTRVTETFLNVCIASKGVGLNIVEFVNELTKNYPTDDTLLSVFEHKLINIGYFNHLLSPELLKVKVERSDYAEISDSNMTFPKKLHDSLPKSVKKCSVSFRFTKLKIFPTNLNDWE